jgi:hypothetical protein
MSSSVISNITATFFSLGFEHEYFFYPLHSIFLCVYIQRVSLISAIVLRFFEFGLIILAQ